MSSTSAQQYLIWFIDAFFIGFAIKLSLYPVFHDYAWWGHDMPAHLNRIDGTVENLKLGQFPPYFDVNYHDYPGYAWNIFYPPLSTVLMSILSLFTNDYNLLVKLSVAVISLITLSTCTLFFRTQTNLLRAILLALIVTLSLYASDNFFVRAAFPESLAMAFLPLVLSGLNADDTRRGLTHLTVGIALIVLSNIPMSLALLLFLVINLCADFSQKKLKQIAFAYLCAGALSAFFTIPLLFHLASESFSLTSTNYFELMRNVTVSMTDFVTGDVIDNSVALKGMILGLGLPLVALSVFAGYKVRPSNSIIISSTILILRFKFEVQRF